MTRLSILLFLFLSPLQAETFYVSPKGKDSNDGGKHAPFATFEKTLEAVSALPRPWKSDVIVKVMPGDYHLKSTLLLTEKHSGDGEQRLIFKNQGALASAKLIGGQKLDPKAWKSHHNGILYQDIPGVERIDILYENGRKGRKARTPNFEFLKDFPVTDGRYFISGRVGKGQPWITAQSQDLSQEQLTQLNQDIQSGDDAYLVIWGHGSCDWHKWIHPITHSEPGSGRIHLAEKKPIFHQGRKDKGCRYYIEGGLRHLDAEREFTFDRARKRLYYKPHGPDPGEVIYATMNNVVKLDGAKNVTFDGLQFTCSGVLPHTDSSYTWKDPDAAMTIHQSKGIEILNCHFKSTGQSAINLEQTDHSRIENCLTQHLGQSGIKLYESDHNTIRNCLIHDIGLRRVYCEGLALHASAHNTVTHLEIHNSARYGITLRGKVYDSGTDRHPTQGNKLSHIRIADVNQDSGDTAGLHMAKINAIKGPEHVNHFEHITVTRSIAQPNITDEWAPTGVYLDHKQMVMNQSMRNIEVTDYDPRYRGYTVKRFNGIYGDKDRTSAKERQIMQNRPWNNESSTVFNCSWQNDFDPKHMEHESIGLTADFPATYRRYSQEGK